MHAPGALAFLVLELDDGDALAVVGPEALVRDVARDGRAICCMRSTSATYSSCRPGRRRERKTVTIMGAPGADRIVRPAARQSNAEFDRSINSTNIQAFTPSSEKRPAPTAHVRLRSASRRMGRRDGGPCFETAAPRSSCASKRLLRRLLSMRPSEIDARQRGPTAPASRSSAMPSSAGHPVPRRAEPVLPLRRELVALCRMPTRTM